jgi:hypothetical protein
LLLAGYTIPWVTFGVFWSYFIRVISRCWVIWISTIHYLETPYDRLSCQEAPGVHGASQEWPTKWFTFSSLTHCPPMQESQRTSSAAERIEKSGYNIFLKHCLQTLFDLWTSFLKIYNNSANHFGYFLNYLGIFAWQEVKEIVLRENLHIYFVWDHYTVK